MVVIRRFDQEVPARPKEIHRAIRPNRDTFLKSAGRSDDRWSWKCNSLQFCASCSRSWSGTSSAELSACEIGSEPTASSPDRFGLHAAFRSLPSYGQAARRTAWYTTRTTMAPTTATRRL